MSSSYYYQKRNPLKPYLMAAAGLLMAGILVVGVSVMFTGESGPNKEQLAALEQSAELLEKNEPRKALDAYATYASFLEPDALPEEKALIVKVKALDQLKQFGELAEAANQFVNAYPESDFAEDAQAMALGAEIQTNGLTKPGLLTNIEDFLRKQPTHPQAPRLQLSLARHEIQIGDMEAGKRRMNKLVNQSNLEPAIGQAVRREVGNLNLKALLNGGSSEVTYTVKSGDSIWQIARDHQVTSELILKVNNISDASKLRIDQTLRIPKTDFSLVCDVSRNELILKNYGEFVKSYTVRTGREAGTTPTGTFKVLNKKENPTWRPGDGRVYHPGDPNNELGTRWMAFEGDILGIHGTLHNETLGAYASNGCIGLSREDVEELFDLILVGTTLEIIGQQDTAFAPVIPAPSIPDPLPKNEIASLN